jgi:replicative DNA helicase
MANEPKFTSMSDAVLEFEKMLEHQTEDDFVETGLPSHDRVLGRLRRNELMFVGARPGMGKTAYMLRMALNQLKVGVNVYFFTLEMSKAIMMARLVSIETGIKLLEIIERHLTEEQVEQIVGIVPQIRELKGEWATEPLLPHIEKLFTQIKPRSRSVAYVDFVGMIDVPGVRAGDAYAATTEIARALKRFAMQWEIPVIAAAQLNRQVELRKDKRPQLSDFRDSGRLEEVGDIVLDLYRDGYYDKKKPDDTMEVLCLKNKNGPTKDYYLAWNPQCAHAWEKAKLSWTE